MATRLVFTCDQCGNEADPKCRIKMRYGPLIYEDYEDDDDDGNQHRRKKSPKIPNPSDVVKSLQRITIELCPMCAPVWMERVRKLTEHTE